MTEFIKILSNISGYSVKELIERNTDPIIQPEDCLEAMKKAINYTHCCKSDSEQLKDEEIPKIDDWIKDLGYKQVTFSFVYKNGGTYKDREQLCKEYKKEFCL